MLDVRIQRICSYLLIALLTESHVSAAQDENPSSLHDVQGKYQTALQHIARGYDSQIEELNRKYLSALDRLHRELSSKGDEEGAAAVQSEINWVRESRDQIPHPWELLDAAAEETSRTAPAKEPGPAVSGAGGPAPLVLSSFWDRRTRGGRKVLADLEALLKDYAKAGVNLSPAPDLEICAGITYLMPVDEAAAALEVDGRAGDRKPVECAGFPGRSFSYRSYPGEFEGGFRTVLLVTDLKDRVVAVQFVREASGLPLEDRRLPFSKDWKVYDMVRNRTKVSADWQIAHGPMFIAVSDAGETLKYRPTIPPDARFELIKGTGPRDLLYRDDALRRIRAAQDGILRLDTWVADGDPRIESTQLRAQVRLYLPRRIAGLILYRAVE